MTALTPPFLIAALVLIVAGVAKLRAPQPPAAATRALGLPVRAWMIRIFAGLECAVGAVALAGIDGAAIALAALYGLFTVLSVLMVRQRLSCGCFGDPDVPASNLGALLSAACAGVSLAAIAWKPHGIGWVIGQTPATAATTLIGIAGAAYAVVIAYTELPLAWAAWSAR
jgi:hypothetical protein